MASAQDENPLDDEATPLYLPLSEPGAEIRVIGVLPGDQASPLECILDTMSLDNPRVYLALSYVWGDGDLSEEIMINGQSVRITNSLGLALRHIRLKHLPFVLWADAVCINQQDETERAWQVQLMGRIYRTATAVIGWLGPHAEDSEYAIDVLSRLAGVNPDQSPSNWVSQEANSADDEMKHFMKIILGNKADPGGDWLSRLPEIKSFLDDEDNTDPLYRIFTPIRAFASRQYWTRLWIHQEIALSREIFLLCGDRVISWHVFMSALTKLDYHGGLNRDFNDNPVAKKFRELDSAFMLPIRIMDVIRTRTHTQQWSDRTWFFFLVAITRRAHATDPRDYIYGLFGLAKSSIAVDYSLPVEDLYTQFASEAMAIDVLSDPDTTYLPLYDAGMGHPRRFSSLPSWVPDLSVREASTSPWNSIQCRAAGESNASMCGAIIDDRKLQIKGQFVDTISRTWPVADEEGWLSLEQLFCVADSIFEDMHDVISLDEITTIFFRTILLNKTQDRLRLLQPGTSEFDALFVAYLSLVAASTNPDPTKWTRFRRSSIEILRRQYGELTKSVPEFESKLGPHSSLALDLRSTISKNIQDKTLFLTENARIGVGFPSSRPGDRVCIVPGHDVPFLLRQFGQCHQLVSTCFVQGLTDGQALGASLEKWLCELVVINMV